MTHQTIPISLTNAEQILEKHYSIRGSISNLPGSEDHNFRVRTEDGDYLLKVSSPYTSAAQVDFQCELLYFLSVNHAELDSPKPIRDNKGYFYFKWTDEGGTPRVVRLLSYVPGRVWSTVNPITDELRAQLGRYCGKLTSALARFTHIHATREFEWDIAQGLWTLNEMHRFAAEEQDMLSYFQGRFSEKRDSYSELRCGIVHNDINDNNIIVTEDSRQPGIRACVDFGDAIRTQLINDVAIAITYAVFDTPDPLQAALPLLRGYHETCPLEENELVHLYDCVGMRLVISLTQSAISKEKDPGNQYLQISEKPAWDLLAKWRYINPDFAHYSFRKACGYTAHPYMPGFKAWIQDRTYPLEQLFPTVGRNRVFPLDLSVGSTWVGLEKVFNDLEFFEYRMNRLLTENPDAIPAGGYMEPRPLYTSEAYASYGNNGIRHRCTHLGVDFWLPAGTPVHAMFRGKVIVAADDKGDKKYGGLIILEHHENDSCFYTLYGHLSLESIRRLKIGDEIPQGGEIGRLGDTSENGNWAPHLHFQITLSLLGNADDFPGVCYPEQAEIWKGICPDPNLLFKADELQVYISHSPQHIHNYRKEHLGRSLSLQYDQPLHIVRGFGAYLVALDGRKYLDTMNNVAHVGHEHPQVVRAGQEQMAVLNTNTRYLHDKINELSRELLQTLPEQLSVVHLVNSGSEANELALRMAKSVTGSEQVIVSQWGYHGNTNACVAISSYKFDRKGGKGSPSHVHAVPMPDPFRGLHRGANSGQAYAAEVEKILQELAAAGKKPGAFIMEPILSCGGQVIPPQGFLERAYESVRNSGGVCISDEVQVGCGRLGSAFWGFELHGVIPDIITIGKPLGNGHPLAAVVCTPAVAEAFANGMEYFNTFGGNPVSCAIGSAVLKVVREENLQSKALETGSYLLEGLRSLQESHRIIGDVRGHGLFLGFELNGPELCPLPDQASYLVNRMKSLGVLMSTDGPDDNVIKIKPPLVFNKHHADYLLECLERVLGEDFMKEGLREGSKAVSREGSRP